MDPSRVLLFAPCKGRVLDLELFLQQPNLVITTDELRPEDVPLVNHGVVLLPLRKSIIVHAADHRRQPSNLRVLLVDDLFIR